ncbi:leucine-rich repeat domain-containing protein [Butyrivibrio sp. MC2021]|uniref:leucine-rich repeat domain-containing protein n=1 Tax=Butyrivibrio sp. MC2021 TaxID=1408306 RepID=UPI00047D797A|nr:leucine-rich repeat domain-containing protein [Butyrivibrio sp. MC2021]
MKRFLAVALSAAMIVSSAVPSFAAEDGAIFLEEAAADEASSSETSEDETTGDVATEDISDDEASFEISLEDVSEELSLEDASEEEVELSDEAASLEDSQELQEADEETAELMANPSKCFGVDENGALTWEGGSGKIPTDAVIPEAVTSIPSGVFVDTRFSKDTTTIRFEAKEPKVVVEEDAFKYCSKPFTVKGAAIKTVEKNAFSGSGVVSVTLENAEKIDDFAFYNCTKLKSLVVGGSLKRIGEYAFYCTQLQELDLTEVTAEGFTMGSKAFEACEKLTDVKLPDVLEEVPTEAFRDCIALKTVIFGTKKGLLHTIGVSAFEGCKAIANLEFYNVKTFGSLAFSGCSALKSIEINYAGEDIAISDNAFPANPANWKIAMRGKSPAVKAYAVRRGYVYYGDEYDIHVDYKYNDDRQFVTVKTLVNNKAATKAEEDVMVTAVVTPKEGYALENIRFATANGANYVDIPATEWKYVGEKDKALTFEFTMQDEDTFIVIDMIANDKIKFNSPSLKIRDNKGDNKIDTAGIQDKVIVYNGSTVVGPWLWNFTSSANSSLSITEDGTITAIKAKEGITITATLKTDSSVKATIKLSVLDSVVVKSIALDKLDETKPKDAAFIPAEYDRGDYDVIEVMSYYNRTSDIVFKVKMKAFATEDGTGKALYAKSTWTSVDGSIAAVESESSYTNENNIIVKKGVRGETMITVSVLNKGDKTATAANTKSFIVRIVDPTPRLRNSEITVNYSSSTGTELGIVPVKGYPVEGSSIRLVDSKGKESKELKVYQSVDGKFYIAKHDNNTKVKSKEYTGDTQLFIAGEFGGNSKGVEFNKLGITKIILTDKPLAPTLTVKGMINLFYKGSSAGAVDVTQSVKNSAVTKYELVSKERKANSKAEDKFRANFNVSYNEEDRTFTITRTGTKVEKDKSGNAVTSGFLSITYAGYSDPVYLALTVPTETADPGYSLSTKKATRNVRNQDHEFDLQLVRKVKVNKKKVQQVLELDESEVELTHDSKYAYEIVSVENDTIKLRHKGYAADSKAQIVVHKDEWGDDLTYTFNLKATNKLPENKLSLSKLTLNRNHPEETATFDLAELSDGEYVDVEAVPTGKNAFDFAKFELTGKNTVTVSFDKTAVASGTYTFSVVPKVSYDSMTESLAPAKIKIVVTDSLPAVKLKSNTLNFNANYPGMETVSTTYTITNLPAGTEKTVDIKEVSFTASGHSYKLEKIAELKSFEGGNISMVLLDTPEVRVNKGKTLKYEVKAKVADKFVDPFYISIKLKDATPKVSVKASGSINPIDRTTMVTYTATVKNLVTTNPGFKLVELDSKGRDIKEEDYHFELVPDEKNTNVVHVKVKDDMSVDNAKSYTIRLMYTNIPSAKVSKLTIKPKQILPKVKSDVKSKTVFALADDRSFNVHVSHVIDKKAVVKEPEIYAITWAKDTPASVKKAFKIRYDFNDADLTSSDLKVELVNPAALVLNQVYTLNFSVQYKDQAPNSTGNTISVKVTVKK